MKTSTERTCDAGFTLPEILVAFVILVLALGVLLPSFSNGLASLDRSTFQAAALAEARSLIDRLGTETPLEEGTLTGTSAIGLDWVIHLRPQRNPEGRGGGGDLLAVIPYEIEVAVSDNAGQTLTIKTLRLAPND
ncbi:MAG: type IV pilus modification PilV family protein [Hypericibacter sp.]